jgi:hypothetical protein
MTDDVRGFLTEIGLGNGNVQGLVESTKRFPDGAQYRVEIPSVEGPGCFEAVLDQARQLGVPVHRVSQGSGVCLMLDGELDRFAELAASTDTEVSLFARPNAGWGLSASARVDPSFGSVAYGQDQLVAVLGDCVRAAGHGFRSVLIADIGALYAFGRARESGLLPPDMKAKVSVMLPVANPATARVVEQLGASTINLPYDLPLADIAAIRAVVDVPLDIYVESPDSGGGIMRYHEIAALVNVAAPVYLKFGLRNAPDVYPSGSHLEATATSLSRARVHRASLGLESLAREAPWLQMSQLGAADLAVPSPGARKGELRTESSPIGPG